MNPTPLRNYILHSCKCPFNLRGSMDSLMPLTDSYHKYSREKKPYLLTLILINYSSLNCDLSLSTQTHTTHTHLSSLWLYVITHTLLKIQLTFMCHFGLICSKTSLKSTGLYYKFIYSQKLLFPVQIVTCNTPHLLKHKYLICY